MALPTTDYGFEEQSGGSGTSAPAQNSPQAQAAQQKQADETKPAEEKPKILASKWVIVEKDEKNNDRYKKIAETKPETKVKVELRINNSNLIAGNNIDIKILDENDKEVGTAKLTVGDDKNTYHSEEVEIAKEWMLKELKIKVEKKSPFEEEFLGKETLSILPFEFAELYIRVIDARSGEPVKYARVKKIVFDNGGAKKIEEEFDREAEKYYTAGANAQKSFIDGGRRYNYNTRSELIQCSMAVLNSLGVYNETTKKFTRKGNTNFSQLKNKLYQGNYLDLFKDYWEKRAPDFKIEMKAGEDDKYRLLLKKMVLHYNSHVVSDNNGWLTLFIPKPFLDNKKVNVEIGFFDFPVVLERTKGSNKGVIRPNTMRNNKMYLDEGKPLKFKIACNIKNGKDGGKQKTKWGDPFGWEIQNEVEKDGSKVIEKSEFLVSENIEIKKADNKKFEKFDSDLCSPFHEAHGFHFTLFAMEWCQPVWVTEIKHDTTTHVIEDDGTKTSIQDKSVKTVNMYIPTYPLKLGGSSGGPFNGKGYGKKEYKPPYPPCTQNKWRGNEGHQGVDISADENDNVFAMHSGYVTWHKWSGSVKNDIGGNRSTLKWNKNGHDFTVGHLHLLDDSCLAKDEYVMAGRLIARAGRTGNMVPNYPGHVHFNLGPWPGGPETHHTRENSKPLHIDNLNLIPFNDMPLLFPCYGIYRKQTKERLKEGYPCQLKVNNCDFNDKDYVSTCWVVAELRCPHMKKPENRKRRIQAQLRYLGYNVGIIDGDWGNKTKAATLAFKKKFTDYNLELNDVIDEATENAINKEAQIIKGNTHKLFYRP